jgi:hypothetical protein
MLSALYSIYVLQHLKINIVIIRCMSRRHDQNISFVVLLFLTTTLIAGFTLTPYSGFASTESNNTLIESEASQGMSATNATTTTTTTSANATTATPNIVLVHGSWVDGLYAYINTCQQGCRYSCY